MKIIEFYTSLLNSLGFVSEDDLLVYADDHTPAYYTYNKEKRRMALPTSNMIKRGMEDAQGKECHAFHPLCESVLTGESGTVRFMKRALRVRVWLNSLELIDHILQIAVEGKSVRAASYKKFLSGICEGLKEPKFDEKLLAGWESVKKDACKSDPKEQTRLYIASNLSIQGAQYVRVANFKHMFEEESLDDTATYFGVKLARKNDKVIIHRLLMAIFGWVPQVTGSNDNRPYFGCLARAWAQYVTNYNEVVRALRDHSPLKPLADEWIGELDTLKQYDNVIQTLPFNTGSAAPETDTTAREFKVTPASSGQSPVAPMASTEPNTGSLDAFLSKHTRPKTSTGVDLAMVPPALRENVASNRPLDNGPSVAQLSLVEAFGGRTAQPSLLGTSSTVPTLTSSSLLGGLTSSSDGLFGTSAPQLTDNRLLGGNGFTW